MIPDVMTCVVCKQDRPSNAFRLYIRIGQRARAQACKFCEDKDATTRKCKLCNTVKPKAQFVGARRQEGCDPCTRGRTV